METSNQEQADAGIEFVKARLTYLAEATPKPVNYTYDPPAGVPRQSGKYAEQSIAVRNGREVLSTLARHHRFRAHKSRNCSQGLL
jgi:hypothetical protein